MPGPGQAPAPRKPSPPGPAPGRVYRIKVSPGESPGTLRFTCPNSGSDCETLTVDASTGEKHHTVVWDFAVAGIEECSLDFPGDTPFCRHEAGTYHDEHRARGRHTIRLRLKTLDWGGNGVTPIKDGQRFKYNVAVRTADKTYKVDPVVIVRGGGGGGGDDEGGG